MKKEPIPLIIYRGLIGKNKTELELINQPLKNMKHKPKTSTGVFFCQYCRHTWELYYLGDCLHYLISEYNLPTLGIERRTCPECKIFTINNEIKKTIRDEVA